MTDAAAHGPHELEVRPDGLGPPNGWARTVAVVGYPAEVEPGWLQPATGLAEPVDVAVHVTPVPAAVAHDRLRRQLARLESSRRLAARRGRLADPEVEVAATDADALSLALARGDGRLFRLGLYATVHGPDPHGSAAVTERLRSLLAGHLLDARPLRFRALEGWLSTLPIGLDAVGLARTFDTAAVAAGFPFASPEATATTGVLLGNNPRGSGLVFADRFDRLNYNAVVLARSGAGKSYLTKLEALRWACAGVEVAVVDPEGEYGRLAAAVGGVEVRLGRPGVRLNPFDLDGGEAALVNRALFLHSLVALLVGAELAAQAAPVLDDAILAT